MTVKVVFGLIVFGEEQHPSSPSMALQQVNRIPQQLIHKLLKYVNVILILEPYQWRWNSLFCET